MIRHSLLVFLVSLVMGVTTAIRADDADEPLPTIAEKTEGMTAVSGLLELYLDHSAGTVWLRVPSATGPRGEVARFLYVESLLTGMGSNDIGLDRGQLGSDRVIALRRVGGRVLIEEANLSFRALSDSADERRAVEQSFATSILWGGSFAALDEDGAALVDWTSFIVRDAHGVAATIERNNQGKFQLDDERSVADLDAILSFPDNMELEALLTFSGEKPGAQVRATAPTADSMTLTQHHSIIRLPDDDYRPRAFDPRIGFSAVSFSDYAAPIAAPLKRRWIVRHRLEKVTPGRAPSRVREPIVYYVDRGAPEPVRSALIEGASWWAEAFLAAGFIDAFRVELMPVDAHPLDVRYNVIQWVHRSTRGWSYGGGISDPRTGEMLKGHVSLGSLRVRQDRLLFEGLLGTAATGSGGPDDPIEIALARIRQLAAHEVGHTLGLSHNFAASTYGRASVMDYPAPLIRIRDDETFDFSDAYGVGVGAWDIQCIRYGYEEFTPGEDESAALDAIARSGITGGLTFLSDGDARPAGAAHPLANLWDNGSDPVAELAHTLKVRALALSRFGEGNVPLGRPLAELEEVLAPVYFHHRYQLDAAVKMIGGLDYAYAVRGDGQGVGRMVSPESQRRALATILQTIEPQALDLPEHLLNRLLPRPFGYGRHPELFRSGTLPAFDALGAAATAADMTIAGLLHPQRCARIVDLHRRDSDAPSLEEVLDTVSARVATESPGENSRLDEIHRVVRYVWVNRLIALSANSAATAEVRARVDGHLRQLAVRFDPGRAGIGPEQAQRFFLRDEIERHLSRSRHDPALPPAAAAPPPGSPIGMPLGHFGGCEGGG